MPSPSNSYLLGQLNKSFGGYMTAVNRLSSGLRINSARDDAAGLSLGTRLSSFATGGQISQRNLNNSVGYLQVTDSALSSISDNLQRLRELSVQSASGTLSNSDRKNLDTEYQQLVSENQRIIDSTSFGGRKVFSEDGSLLDNFISSSSSQKLQFDTRGALINNSRGLATFGALQTIWGRAGMTNTVVGVMDFNPPGIANLINAVNDGVYNIQVDSMASAYDINDTIGPNGTSYGTAASGSGAVVGSSTTNSNPSVISVNGTPSRGGYDVEVLTTGRQQINVITGVAAIQGSDTALGDSETSQSTVDIQFDNGDVYRITPSTASAGGANGDLGRFSTQELADNITTFTGGRVTATYDSISGTLTYTGRVGETFSVYSGSIVSGSQGLGQITDLYEQNDVFNTDAGTFVQEAQDFTGYVNGQYFSSTTNNITSTVNGATLNFNILNTGRSYVKRVDNTAGYGISNSNESVAYQVGSPTAGNYNVRVDQLATRQISVINGVSGNFGVYAAGSNPNLGLFYDITAVPNDFTVQFADGSNFVFDVDTSSLDLSGSSGNSGTFQNNTNADGGFFTAEQFVASLNLASNGRITADYNSSTGQIRLTSAEGANNNFTISFVPASDASSTGPVNNSANSAFNVNAGNTIQQGVNAIGNINGTAFNVSSNTIATAGIGIRALSVGNTLIQAGPSGTPASNESFTINFGDGTGPRTFNLTGGFTAQDYVSAFNAASLGKVLASFNAATGTVEYRGTQTGANRTYGVTGTIAQFDTGNATVINAAANTAGNINGSPFSSNTNTISAVGVTLDILSTGLTQLTYIRGGTTVENDGQFGDINTKDEAVDKIDLIDSYMNLVTNSRAKVGSFINRLESVISNLDTEVQNLIAGRGRIMDADFAAETSRLSRNQILMFAGTNLLRTLRDIDRQKVLLIEGGRGNL